MNARIGCTAELQSQVKLLSLVFMRGVWWQRTGTSLFTIRFGLARLVVTGPKVLLCIPIPRFFFAKSEGRRILTFLSTKHPIFSPMNNEKIIGYSGSVGIEVFIYV